MKMLRNFWPQGAVDSQQSTVHCGLSTVDCRLYLILFLFTIISSSSVAQNIIRAEYFFDTDPGIGNGTLITFIPTGGDVTFTSSIPTLALSSGFHQLAIRVKETGGSWSEFESRGFYITAATANVVNLSAAEYFLDTDPGVGNGTAIPITSGATANFVVSVPTTSLSNGFHFLAIRTKDLNGKWGEFESRGFYISTATTNVSNIVAAEYFFDADPGNGSGISIPVTPGATVNFTASLPATGLPTGFHFLAIRTKGSNGKWGIFESRGFYVSSSTTNVPNIAGAEYFFDTDPGVGNGLPIPITAGATTNFAASLPVAGLLTGFHFLAIRTKDVNGKWGEFESRGFYISPIAANTSDIVAAEYFIDTDPGEDNAFALTVNPTGPTINQIFPIDLTGVPSGSHKLGIRVKDADGIWSEVERGQFDILSCIPPTAPVTTGASRCGAGSVALLASGATGSQEYRWYEDNITTTSVTSVSPFNTPVLSSTKNYYVSIYDPATTCESSRSIVIGTVSVLAKPSLNLSGSVNFCEGNSIILNAPAGFSNYVWSNSATSQTIAVDTTGNYTVSVSNNGICFSATSDPVNVTVLSGAAKPIIQITGSTVLCDVAGTTLSGPSGFQYLWSTGATTQDIVVNKSGTYSLVVRSGSGCSSVTSDPIVITSGGTEAFITQSGNLLIASAGSSYKWFVNGSEIPGATSQVLEIGVIEFGIYAVEVNDKGCISLSDDFVYLITAQEAELPLVDQIFPNPFRDNLTVNLNEKGDEIKIADGLGKVLIEKPAEKGINTLETSSIASGMYYLFVKSHDHVVVFKIQKL